MTPKEFSKETGYSVSHSKTLCQQRKIKSKKVKIPGGFVYDIPDSEVKRVKQEGKDNRGWNSINPVED